jgi:hypothetical protein
MARQRSTGIAASLSSMFEWKVASHDANQAYIILYSRQEYEQGRFHNTSPELNIEIGNYLTLLKPLYGLTDSGDIWYDTLFEFLENDMGMRQCVSDRALLYLRKAKGYIIGLFRCFVDDIFISGTETFHTVSKTLSQRFLSRDRESNSFTLAGVSVLQINPKSYISLSQTRYGHDIPLSNTETSFKHFRGTRAKLQWLTHTGPGIYGAVVRLAQVTEAMYTAQSISVISKINKSLNRIHKINISLNYPALIHGKLRIVVYSDSSYKNTHYLSTQIGH